MNKYIVLILLFSTMLNPVFGQTKKEDKQIKKQQEYETMKNLIDSKQFEFTGEWATSSKGRRISLLSNPTFLKVDNSATEGYFPFFGTGYSSSGYGSGGAIEFKDPLDSYTVTLNDKKQLINIKFKAKGTNDNYDVILKVFGSGSTTININSNNRSTMSYSGKIKALEKKE